MEGVHARRRRTWWAITASASLAMAAINPPWLRSARTVGLAGMTESTIQSKRTEAWLAEQRRSTAGRW